MRESIVWTPRGGALILQPVSGSRVCYLEIPARSVEESSRFYERVFGWSLRERGDGAVAFDDAGGVSGVWVTDRAPMTELGILIYIMVDDAEAAVADVVAAGGAIVAPLGFDPHEIAARFTDPAGNVLGIYQE
jgi:predicted enzyme related to lactoylglutathione lyase